MHIILFGALQQPFGGFTDCKQIAHVRSNTLNRQVLKLEGVEKNKNKNKLSDIRYTQKLGNVVVYNKM